jgi:glycosyltransferase involved in cell wall biosynthesis
MTEDIRAIIVDLSKRFGGASTRSVTLAEGLKSWHIAIAGLTGSPVIEMAKKKGIPVITVGKSRINPLIPLRLAGHIRRDGFQIIDTQNIQSKFWGSIAALLTNAVLVSTLNSWYISEHGGSLKGKFYSAIDYGTNWKIDRYVVVSETIKKSLLASGIKDSFIDVIHNAIGVDCNQSSLDSRQLRDGLGLPQDSILCIAVGRLVWAKGFDDLITAFASVENQIHNAYLLIVGGGELFSTLSEQIAQTSLQNKILLLGYRDREYVQNLLRCADIFIMSSRSEGVPYALLEAAAVGLPIVATECGGIPEVVTNRVEAVLVPVGNIPALSTAIVELCNRKEYAKDLGRNAQKRIKTEYSLESQANAVRLAYLKALDHKRNRKELILSD